MMIDKFIVEVGLCNASQELSKEALDVLTEQAELFIRSFGNVSWDFWCSLGPQSKAAFADAGDRVRQEMVAAIGFAAQSPINALSLVNEDAAKDAIANQTVNETVVRMEQKTKEKPH